MTTRARRAALVFLFVFLALSGRAAAQGFDFNIAGDIQQKIAAYIPPIIDRVWLEPEQPAAGDDITVSAEIVRLDITGDKLDYVEEAFVEYSTDDGETWEEVEMEQDEDDDSLWTAEIPARDEPCELIYKLRAKDSVGNVAVEMPNPSAEEEDYTERALALKVEDDDEDAEEDIPDYFNVLDVNFDYDEENYYFRVNLAAKPETGTITPIDANGYGLLIINKKPAIDLKKVKLTKEYVESISDRFINDMADHVWAWYHAPLAEIAPPLPGIGKIPGTGMVHVNKKNVRLPLFETKGFEYKIDGSALSLKIERAFLSETPTDTLMFMFFNIKLAGSDFRNVKPKPGDISRATVVHLTRRSVEIE